MYCKPGYIISFGGELFSNLVQIKSISYLTVLVTVIIFSVFWLSSSSGNLLAF